VVDFGTLNLTYPDSRSKAIQRQAVQFAIVSLTGLGIRSVIFALSEPMMARIARQLLEIVSVRIESLVLGTNLAVALAVVVVLFWNFGVNRLWTYSDV
jgi:putative flippase GtrA